VTPDNARQLELIRELSAALRRERIHFWLRGGWAEPSPNPATQMIFTRYGEELSVLLVARSGRDVFVPGSSGGPSRPVHSGASVGLWAG
jgi:hypothetical protein